MIAYIVLILMSWSVSMPLWLSILNTVLCGICAVAKCIEIGKEL